MKGRFARPKERPLTLVRRGRPQSALNPEFLLPVPRATKGQSRAAEEEGKAVKKGHIPRCDSFCPFGAPFLEAGTFDEAVASDVRALLRNVAAFTETVALPWRWRRRQAAVRRCRFV
jgi:hypothetical protein